MSSRTNSAPSAKRSPMSSGRVWTSDIAYPLGTAPDGGRPYAGPPAHGQVFRCAADPDVRTPRRDRPLAGRSGRYRQSLFAESATIQQKAKAAERARIPRTGRAHSGTFVDPLDPEADSHAQQHENPA